jgi:hypothetical protein
LIEGPFTVPALRITSTTGTLTSDHFNTPAMYSTENRFFFIGSIPPPSRARFWPNTNIYRGSRFLDPTTYAPEDFATAGNVPEISAFMIQCVPLPSPCSLALSRVRKTSLK